MSGRRLDLRHEQTDVNQRAACKYVGGRPLARTLGTVTGVTLHQTACWYSVNERQRAASGGDEQLARHRRALKVHAHITAMRHGRFVVGHDPLVYVNHGHLLNGQDVGLEHEGLYAVDGAPEGLPKAVEVGEIIEAGREALTWLSEELPALRWLHAHRQSMRAPGRAKTSDPGARIWREVALEHGVKRLGLAVEPERTWGTGKPIPASWT